MKYDELNRFTGSLTYSNLYGVLIFYVIVQRKGGGHGASDS